MKKNIAFFSVFIILFLGCNTGPNEIKNGLPFIIFKLGDNSKPSDSSGKENVVIRLYENGTYSHFGCNFFAYGNWQWDGFDKIVTLEPTISKDSNITQQFKVERKYENHYVIKNVIMQKGKRLVQQYENAAMGFATSVTKDPFSKEMNTWRIKPAKPESAEEIKQRTLHYLQFLLAYYEFIQTDEINFLAYGWYATPIQMHYGNGVKMSYNNELADWYSCFYSIEDGNQAYILIGTAMRKSKLKDMESIGERNIEYLKQLIAALK